jgi:LysR family nitrogen assimilation transcriptional regulator
MLSSLDLRRLRYFIKVAELGSLTRAAVALHVAQPALSQQIRLLESEIGVALLDRGPRGVTVTDAGQRMLAEARRLVDGMPALVERVRAPADPEGEVVIGLGQSIAPVLVVPLLQRASEYLPRVRIQVRELLGGLLSDLICSGAIDFALSLNTVTGRGIRSLPVFSEEMRLVGQQRLIERHLKRRPSNNFAFREMHRLPLYLSRRGQFVRDTIENAARSKGISLNLVAEVDSMYILKELALSGAGCCVLSHSNVRREQEDHNLYIGRISGPVIRRDVFLVQHEALSRQAYEVAKLSIDVLAEMVADNAWSGTLKIRPDDIRKTL